MENKQTAVNWLIESLESLEYNLEKGIISVDDYIVNLEWVKSQAKVMEKDQMIELWREDRFTKEAPLEYMLSEFDKRFYGK
jgi:hypothetical protein